MQNWEIEVPPPTWVDWWQQCGLPPRAWLHGDPFKRGCSSFCTSSPAATWLRERVCRFEVSKLFNFVIFVYFVISYKPVLVKNHN